MGTALLANSTVKLSFGWNAFFFWGTWAVCFLGLGVVLWSALRSKRWDRWTTQDILIVASLGVILEVCTDRAAQRTPPHTPWRQRGAERGMTPGRKQGTIE
jgi:integral membrane sensor domain MASE1